MFFDKEIRQFQKHAYNSILIYSLTYINILVTEDPPLFGSKSAL